MKLSWLTGQDRLIALYISKTIVSMVAMVTLVLLGLELFILLVGQLDEIGSGNYHLWQAVLYALGALPLRAYTLFPLAALLGCLLGLGVLASHSELISMQAAGVSMQRITWIVMRVALLLVLLVTVIGECVGPHLAQSVAIDKAVAISRGQALKTAHGTWVRNGNSYIRIETVSGKHLQGVTTYAFDEGHQLQTASFAERAEFKDSHWLLYNVVESHLSRTRVTVKRYPEKRSHMKLNPKMLGAETLEPSQLNLIKLYKLIVYRRHNGLQTSSYWLVFWQRLLQPFATAVMMFLAIPFIFGPLRTVTMGLRIVSGVIVGFGFYLFNQFVGPASLVYQIPPLLSAAAPTVVFAGVAAWLMMRVSRR